MGTERAAHAQWRCYPLPTAIPPHGGGQGPPRHGAVHGGRKRRPALTAGRRRDTFPARDNALPLRPSHMACKAAKLLSFGRKPAKREQKQRKRVRRKSGTLFSLLSGRRKIGVAIVPRSVLPGHKGIWGFEVFSHHKALAVVKPYGLPDHSPGFLPVQYLSVFLSDVQTVLAWDKKRGGLRGRPPDKWSVCHKLRTCTVSDALGGAVSGYLLSPASNHSHTVPRACDIGG